MPISKHTRFMVLRRDNHTCRYCGHAAPAVALTMDHVMPQSLGGNDAPGNLVAACLDCNIGKSNTLPTAAFVAEVIADQERWEANHQDWDLDSEWTQGFTAGWDRATEAAGQMGRSYWYWTHDISRDLPWALSTTLAAD